jgi:putative sigma-54 modulation protein
VLVEVIARHLDISDRIRTYAEEKATRITRFFGRVDRVHVVLDHVHGERRVEIVVHLDSGAILVADERAEDLFAAIDLATDKLKQQVMRHKQKLLDRRQRPSPRIERAVAAVREETYEEIVRREVRGHWR